MKVSRRDFLQTASASLSVAWLDHIPAITSPDDLEKTFTEIRANLLEMVNEERAVARASPVALDEFATQVANGHALDMANGEFASHWGRDGRKPYHRYSFAGGTEATAENVSAADNTWSMKTSDLRQDSAYLHVRLYQEKPPYDGHRKTILAPQHTHVGIGLAIEKLRLRLVELFVSKYVEVAPVKRTAKPGEKISFAGKLLTGNHILNSVEIFYEPMPKPPELSWLREPHSYALPMESKVLRPRLPMPYTYVDRSSGDVEVWSDGRFRVPVSLFKREPGIYTIVAWIRKSESEKAFPATEVCIEAL